MPLNPGQQFGNYEITRLLGTGGMGEVYLAHDARLNRQVAIKVLSRSMTDNPEMLVRFRKEAELAAVLNHPNICTIYETGEVDGCTYICMEYVEGRTLRDRMAREAMNIAEILDVAIQIADALEEARSKGIVHRDIKSLNILLTSRGRVKVMDFGLAKQLESVAPPESSGGSTLYSLTQDGDMRGTPAYMSPEQALGRRIDHRSDIFSFGVLLYEMITGRLPFQGKSITEVVDAILHQAPVPVTRYNDTVPPELVLILMKMLQKDPAMRYQSVHEVWIDLRRIKGDTTPPVIRTIPDVVRRRFHPVAIIAPLLLTGLIAAGSIYFGRRAQSPAATQPGKVSVAVLPFQYVGEDPTRQYLGTLVTDALIAGLQPSPDLMVAPYANVRDVGSSEPLSKVMKTLGVQCIVRGTVNVRQDKTDITTEVVSSDGTTLWKGNMVERPVTALTQARKEILNVLGAGPAAKEIEQLRSPSMEAYRNYLDARNKLEGWDVQRNLEEAVRLYRAAIQADPDFAAAHAGLAVALLKRFDAKKEASLLASAQEEAQRAFGLEADLPEALLAYGMVQAESGNSVEARDAFARAIEVAPGDDSACRNMADMYSVLGRHQEAEAMYKKAVALRPSLWKNHYALGTFQWQYAGNLDAARTHLQKAVDLHPEGYAPLVMLGNVCLVQGDLQGAETYFRKALERSPNAFAYNNLGMVYYYRDQYELALRNWTTVLNNAPNQPIYQANVADALRQLGRTEEAKDRYKHVIDGFRESLKLNPSDDRTRAALSMALAAIGRCSEGSAEARNVLTRHPNSTEFLEYAAITAGRCEDLKWAKELALTSIAAGNLLVIQFDPDLETVRQLPDVKDALARATQTKATARQ